MINLNTSPASSPQDLLLQLIEEGDATTILSDENSSGFVLLMKHELISFDKGILILTPLGIEAKEIGVEAVIQRLQIKPVAAVPVPAVRPENNKKLLIISALILLSLVILLSFLYSL